MVTTMTKLIVQLLCLLVAALVLSDGKKWNIADPVVKFYCQADHLRNVSINLLYKHVSYCVTAIPYAWVTSCSTYYILVIFTGGEHNSI